MIFPISSLQVCGKQKGAGAAIRNFGSGSGRQFNFGSSARQHCLETLKAPDLSLFDEVNLVLEDEDVLQLHNLNGGKVLCAEVIYNFRPVRWDNLIIWPHF